MRVPLRGPDPGPVEPPGTAGPEAAPGVQALRDALHDPGVSGLPIELDSEFGCWLWRGKLRDGYGQWGDRAAHRVLWELEHDPLPMGVQLDHMCRRRACVRPCHMDPVTGSENLRRTFARYRRGLERCPEGHRLVEHGKETPEGGIVCRVCSNLV